MTGLGPRMSGGRSTQTIDMCVAWAVGAMAYGALLTRQAVYTCSES